MEYKNYSLEEAARIVIHDKVAALGGDGGVIGIDKNGNVVPNMSLGTHAASGVPGSVHGLLTIFNDYGSGKISREKVLSPAIELAKKGFRLTHSEAMNLNDEDGSNFANE